ncbi:MAG: 3-deoxy-manno-octulosonate cytidylyltransferase [Phycisphaerales bacterium]|nr:3-deoxy-manno-octulosonate cytidylyltransferase [Phycisphaerales bacterium]
MSAVVVIPARFGAVRFPGKPIARQTGKFLVQHVYERAADARGIDRVIVACDDRRIADAVDSFGGQWVMTRGDHASGTDRVAEVARGLNCDVVINVQGDEPEIEPESIETLARLMGETRHPMGTLACPFAALAQLGMPADSRDPNRVKVVIGGDRALYFSRSPIPFERNRVAEFDGPFLHLGIYGYRRSFLLQMAEMAPTALERIEGLEQLRVLENGHSIAIAIVGRAAVGIDTPEDYAAFVKRQGVFVASEEE